jgi:hypothetical protein
VALVLSPITYVFGSGTRTVGLFPISDSFVYVDSPRSNYGKELYVNAEYVSQRTIINAIDRSIAPLVHIVPSTTLVNIDQTFTVNVTIANVTDLYGYEFILFWNNTALCCIEAIRTPPWNEGFRVAPPPEPEQNYNLTHGRYIHASAQLSPNPPFSGTVSVVTLVFKATAISDSTLAIRDIIIVNSNAEVMPHEAVDGLVEIVEMVGDIDNDGKVNILDICIVAVAFGSTPVDSRWNQDADVDRNGIVDIVDISIVARDFGRIHRNDRSTIVGA